MVTIIPIPAFADNYIWTLREGGNAVVVDPGDAAPVLAYLDREGLALTAILATHHHNDHVGGVPALVERYAVPVFGPANETIPARTRALREADTIEVPGLPISLRVLDMPGHTAGHIALHGADMLFCGDTLFACGCGRLFEGTPEQMWNSLGKLRRLPDETEVYCGHEYTEANARFACAIDKHNAALAERAERVKRARAEGRSTVPARMAEERATNPFLRADDPKLAAAVGMSGSEPVDVFAEIRRRKDNF